MSAVKHTPGPWRVVSWMHQKSAPKIHVETAYVMERICTLTPKANGQKIEANAQLIAAAPALADALEAMMVDAETHRARDQAYAALRAAGRLP